jgi:hypothetical protein
MKMNFRVIGKFFLGSLLFSVIVFNSCKKDDNKDNGGSGKTDPTTIANSNLVAYFPFDDNGNDQVGNLTPKASPGVTFVTGRRGKAYQGADNAYLLYDLPSASKLKTLKAFTVAMWFYGTPAVNEVVPVPGILQIGGTSDPVWGNLVLTQDRVAEAADSLNLKIVFHKEGAVWNNQFVNVTKPEILENKWMHLVLAYDNTTSKFSAYVNGAPLNLPAGTTDRWAAGEEVTPRPALGDLAFNNATQFSIGGWMQKILGVAQDQWMGYFTGKMDELRIYDKGLSATEVKNLYDAEVTQLTQ